MALSGGVGQATALGNLLIRSIIHSSSICRMADLNWTQTLFLRRTPVLSLVNHSRLRCRCVRSKVRVPCSDHRF